MTYAHISKIDANLLVILDALLQESSVTEAARQVGLSQSAVSHALARLREHLDDPLLVRAGRRMVLTPKAMTLAPRVQQVLEEIENIFTAEVPFEPNRLNKAFRVHIPESVRFILGPALDNTLGEQAPQVELYTCSLIPGAVNVELRKGSIDLAIDDFAELFPDLNTAPLFTDRLVCVVRKKHPVLAAAGKADKATKSRRQQSKQPRGPGSPPRSTTPRPRLTIEQYAALPHLLITSLDVAAVQPHDQVDDILAAHGLTRRVARVVPHALLALFIVACSDYIATVPEQLATKMAALLDIDMIEPPVAMPPYSPQLAWHERHTNDPAHHWLRTLIARLAPPTPLTQLQLTSLRT